MTPMDKVFRTLARKSFEEMHQILFERFHTTTDTGFKNFNLDLLIYRARKYKYGYLDRYTLVKGLLKANHWTVKDYLEEEKK